MFHYLHLRSRFLQTLILALVGLTFYAYYRTTVYDVHQYSLPRNISEHLQFLHGSFYIGKIIKVVWILILTIHLRIKRIRLNKKQKILVIYYRLIY